MSTDLIEFILGVTLNLLVAGIIVRYIYYPVTQAKKYVFTFLAFNTIIYLVLSLLQTAEMGVGVGFGLFAIFSVLHYRTDPLPIREMTYLFIIIALPVVNSVLMASGDLVRLAVADAAVVALLYVLEREWGFRYEVSRRVTYERIELITPAHMDLLLADLCERTGLPVKRVEVGRYDFSRDIAELRVYYDEPRAAAAAERSPSIAASWTDDQEDGY